MEFYCWSCCCLQEPQIHRQICYLLLEKIIIEIIWRFFEEKLCKIATRLIIWEKFEIGRVLGECFLASDWIINRKWFWVQSKRWEKMHFLAVVEEKLSKSICSPQFDTPSTPQRRLKAFNTEFKFTNKCKSWPKTSRKLQQRIIYCIILTSFSLTGEQRCHAIN